MANVVKIEEQENAQNESKAMIDALSRSQAMIEFELDGTIKNTNDNFLSAMGYRLDEVQGKHHRMFVTPDYASSVEYRNFWKTLESGEFHLGLFLRQKKNGDKIWIRATYNPLIDENGDLYGVMKMAADVTEQQNELAAYRGKLAAIDRSQAVIEFKTDGTILTADENFLNAVGYSLPEIQGQHHKIFCDPTYARTQEYASFWTDLAKGEFKTGEYKRFGKDNAEIWISASYNPVVDAEGQTVKIVKFATDITDQKNKNLDYEGKIEAISRAQAMIEFQPDGTIVDANDNFLNALGYSIDEIKGRHHRIFCEVEYGQSSDYKLFWEKLARGEYQVDEFKRLAKNGNEVWISASYNPIFDDSGKVVKVVKFATDVTERKLKNADYHGQISAIGKLYATIEFNLDGSVIDANKNFLDFMGYQLDEIKGRHHRTFVDSEFANSIEYREFWDRLGRGEFHVGQFKRKSKQGRDIYIQASYNPIMDLNGKPFKVVKYATDLTAEKEAYNNLVENFGLACEKLSSASEKLSATATQLSDNSNKTTETSNTAASSAEEVSSGVVNVVTNTEELAASVKEIAAQANEASMISQEAAKESESAAVNIRELGEASKEIGNVIKVISSIAQQTNLLALNATIEAARAGDAGRGFAVVANEVKELAKQTANATEEITAKILGIQESTTRAVAGNEKIAEVINKLNSIAGTTAAAVEEQTATTREVARTLSDSQQGVQKITESIRDVATASTENAKGAADTLEAAKTLSGLAEDLSKKVEDARMS